VAKEYDSKEGFVIRSPSETDIRWEAGTNIQAYPSKAVLSKFLNSIWVGARPPYKRRECRPYPQGIPGWSKRL